MNIKMELSVLLAKCNAGDFLTTNARIACGVGDHSAEVRESFREVALEEISRRIKALEELKKLVAEARD